MVVFVDLEEDDEEPHLFGRHHNIPHHHHPQFIQLNGIESDKDHEQEIEQNSTTQAQTIDENAALFASTLACYPVSLSLATHLDLIDLFALGLTSRSIHHSITQFAHQLRVRSLRCMNDEQPLPLNLTIDNENVGNNFSGTAGQYQDLYHTPSPAPAFPLPYDSDGGHFHGAYRSALGLTGKIGKCARDMVAPCRRCGLNICRNCAAKPPSDRCLPQRFRRLCQTCLDAPLLAHLQPFQQPHACPDSPPSSSASSARSVSSISAASASSHEVQENEQDSQSFFTTSAFLRQPCTCSTRGVYLCQPCGQNLKASDTTYKRVWTWRSRYSTHIGGGLGTGLGLGNQGQKCARGDQCLERGAGGICWVEIECSEIRTQAYGRDDQMGASRSGTPVNSDLEKSIGSASNKPGYLSQEIEGIGGVVKKKVKKRVKVGATVHEYDDERASGRYLEREAQGKQRGYCGWCARVCLDQNDAAKIQSILI